MPTCLSESHTIYYPLFLIKPVIQHPMFVLTKFSYFISAASFASLFHVSILTLVYLGPLNFVSNLLGMFMVEKK
jgi:hypothetical protein